MEDNEVDDPDPTACVSLRAGPSPGESGGENMRKKLAQDPGGTEDHKVGQLLGPHGTVFQTTIGSMEARKILKRFKIDPLPQVLATE